MKNLTDALSKIDWTELHKQKLTLLSLLLHRKDLANKKFIPLHGLVNLLDALGDSAEKDSLWVHPATKTETL